MKQLSWRVLPTLLVAALLALALAGPLRRSAANADGASTQVFYPRCDVQLQQGGGTDPYQLSQSNGVIQPLGAAGNVSACSLYISVPLSSAGQLEVVLWDPLTLAPDPTTIALRSRAYQSSELGYNHLRENFDPPIVTRRSVNLAEPPRGTVALDYLVPKFSNAQTLHYDPAGSASTPVAMRYWVGGYRTPLDGPHPVLSHVFCGGDADLQALEVVQSVMTTNALLDTSSYEYAQLFSVPVLTRLHWVELAFGTTQARGGVDPGAISIVDAQGAAVPPVSMPGSMIQALFWEYVQNLPHWESHYDFDQFITLMPGHDYWLVVRTNHDYRLYSRIVTGSESADFTNNIGGLYARLDPAASWGAVSARALDFRIIGEPLGLLDVPPAPAAPSPLQLRVAPNPSKGTAFVSWSGASGAVRFEVMDVRGRRVGSGASSAGAVGRWLWRAAGADGHPLEAGVYFLRAVDGAGKVAIQRVVLVR